MTHAAAIESGWTRSLARGERPGPENLREHLRLVHHVHAGFTESCAAGCRDDTGRNSYEWLADTVPATAGRVLDVACGSGVLLELCRRRLGPDVDLVGLDMSPHELAMARDRLSGAVVTLHEGMAQSMAIMADASVDAILCHWALTLMEPVGPAIEEVRRILRPGGVFAAIVDGPVSIAPRYGEVDALIFEAVARAYPRYGSLDLGDPRVRDASALTDLMAEVLPGAAIEIEHSVMSLTGQADHVAAEAAGFFYAAFVLTPEARAAMLRDLARLLEASASGGTCRFDLPVSRLTVRTRA